MKMKGRYAYESSLLFIDQKGKHNQKPLFMYCTKEALTDVDTFETISRGAALLWYLSLVCINKNHTPAIMQPVLVVGNFSFMLSKKYVCIYVRTKVEGCQIMSERCTVFKTIMIQI